MSKKPLRNNQPKKGKQKNNNFKTYIFIGLKMVEIRAKGGDKSELV